MRNLLLQFWNGKLFFYGNTADLLSKVTEKVKVIELTDENELLALQRKTPVLSTTYEHNAIHARIMDENNLFSAQAVAETLEDAYVYCMGGKKYE